MKNFKWTQMAVNNSDNKYGVAKWIVDPTAGNGTHTTIASALTSASSGDTIFIRPGTYTEDLTLKAGVSLTAFDCNSQQRNVIISGNATATFAGTASISGIALQTNSTSILSVTGSSATVIRLFNCYLNVATSSQTGIVFSSSSASASIEIKNCSFDLNAATTKVFAHSSAGSMTIDYSYFSNTISSTTASTCSAGALGLQYDQGYFFLAASGTSSVSAMSCLFGSISNTTQVVVSGTSATVFTNSRLQGGSSAAVTVGSGSNLVLHNCILDSTNTNAVSGAGTVFVTPISYTSTGQGNSVTTVNDHAFGRKGTWTPVVTFGGGNTGLTYTIAPTGTYWRIGSVVFFKINFTINSNGTSTGEFRVTIPFTSAADQLTRIPAVVFSTSNAFVGTGTMSMGAIGVSETYMNVGSFGDAGFTGNLDETNFTNGSALSATGFYWVT